MRLTSHQRVGLVLLAALLSAHGCSGQAPTSPVLGYEMDDFACDDGRDNDHDGLYDCEDPDCVLLSTHCGEHIPLVPPDEPEGSFATCHDQIDNDGNGQFDKRRDGILRRERPAAKHRNADIFAI